MPNQVLHPTTLRVAGEYHVVRATHLYTSCIPDHLVSLRMVLIMHAATDNHAVGEMSRKPTPFGCSDGDGAPNPPATVRRTSTACGHPRNRTNKDLTSGRLRGATPTTAGRRRDVGWAESRGIRVAGPDGSERPVPHTKAPR